MMKLIMVLTVAFMPLKAATVEEAKHFKSFDSDGDMRISDAEALTKTENSIMQGDEFETLFQEMDIGADNNDYVSPSQEFNYGITDEAMDKAYFH